MSTPNFQSPVDAYIGTGRMTQKELSEAINCTLSTVGRLMKGAFPRGARRVLLAKIMKIDFDRYSDRLQWPAIIAEIAGSDWDELTDEDQASFVTVTPTTMRIKIDRIVPNDVAAQIMQLLVTGGGARL